MIRFISNHIGGILVFITLLLYSHFFNFLFWANTKAPIVLWSFIIVCVIISVMHTPQFLKQHDCNKKILQLMVLMPLIASGVKILVTDQGFETERISFLLVCSVFQYNMLKICRTTEQDIILAIIFFGIITFIIQVYQQYNPPFFGIIYNDENMIGFQRNGIYRYFIGTFFISILMMMYFWNKITTSFNVIYALLFVLFSASMYLYVTRQLMIVSFLTIALSCLKINKSRNWLFITFLFCLIIYLLIDNYDVLFGDLTESYKSDSFTTDIRQECLIYTIGEIFSNPILALLGHGRDVQFELACAKRDYYMADIGFVGQIFYYGILWVLCYFIFAYRVIVKYRKLIPNYVTLFVITTLLLSISISLFSTNVDMFLWICIMYISHIYIDKQEINNCKTLI